jgi:hypothetical protein
MEYLLGSLVTLFALLIVSSIVKKEPPQKYSIRHTQSNTYSLIAPYVPIILAQHREIPITQSSKHFASSHSRIVFFENKAYWIANNSFVEADLVDGEIDQETKRAVDIMAMNKLELEKMMFIVEKLTEGTINDSGSTGK